MERERDGERERRRERETEGERWRDGEREIVQRRLFNKPNVRSTFNTGVVFFGIDYYVNTSTTNSMLNGGTSGNRLMKQDWSPVEPGGETTLMR